MSLHRVLSGADLHSVVWRTFANATLRTAVGSYATTDVGKIAWQTDDDTLWLLKSVSSPGGSATPTWIQVNGTISGGGSSAFNPRAVAGTTHGSSNEYDAATGYTAVNGSSPLVVSQTRSHLVFTHTAESGVDVVRGVAHNTNLPSGDWTIDAHLAYAADFAPGGGQYAFFGISLFEDTATASADLLTFGLSRYASTDNALLCETLAEYGNPFTTGYSNRFIAAFHPNAPLAGYFRMVKSSTNYKLYFGGEGAGWRKVYEGTISTSFTKVGLVSLAKHSGSSYVTRGISDFVRVYASGNELDFIGA